MTTKFFSIRIHENITRKQVLPFASTLVLGLIAHLFIFTNYIPNWDGLNNFYDSQNTIHLGRCFLTLACGISSYYDLPMVNGLLSLIYLGLTAVILCELFSVRKDSSRILIGGLLATFPVVTSTFSYMYTADGYFLAMLLMTLGISLVLRNDKKPLKAIFAGSALIAFAFGCYQAYITFAIMIVLVYSIDQLLHTDASVRNILKKWLHCLLSAGIGLALYMTLNTILLAIQGKSLASYQGIGEAGSSFSVSGLLHAPVQCVIDFVYFFTGSLSKLSLYSVLNLLMLILLAIRIVSLIITNKIAKTPSRLIFLIICLCLMPFACFAIYFLTPDVMYHMLMHGSLYLVYALFILLLDREEASCKGLSKYLRPVSFVLAALMIYNFIVIANICYQRQNLAFTRSMHTMDEMVDHMHELDNLEDATQITVVGQLGTAEDNRISISLPPDMTGFTDGYIMSNSLHYSHMLEDYYGIQLAPVSSEQEDTINASTLVTAMPCWPEDGSIQVIDNVLVIKLSN